MTEKDRLKEWLTRAAEEVNTLRRKPRLGNDKKLAAIRDSYSIISVLIKVAEGRAYMIGITPIVDTTKA